MRDKGVFELLNDFIRGSETSVVNLLSAVGPWLAPAAPAVMSYQHMISTLEFPTWVAFFIAFVIETLGLSSVNTIISFWMFNRGNRARAKEAPVGLTISAFFFYLLIVIVLNVALDAATLLGADPIVAAWTLIAARALLTLLSIPAALIMAVRTGHKELIDLYERERSVRSVSQKVSTTSAHLPRVSTTFPTDWRKLSTSQIKLIAQMSPSDLSDQHGIPPSTARRWVQKAREESK